MVLVLVADQYRRATAVSFVLCASLSGVSSVCSSPTFITYCAYHSAASGHATNPNLSTAHSSCDSSHTNLLPDVAAKIYWYLVALV